METRPLGRPRRVVANLTPLLTKAITILPLMQAALGMVMPVVPIPQTQPTWDMGHHNHQLMEAHLRTITFHHRTTSRLRTAISHLLEALHTSLDTIQKDPPLGALAFPMMASGILTRGILTATHNLQIGTGALPSIPTACEEIWGLEIHKEAGELHRGPEVVLLDVIQDAVVSPPAGVGEADPQTATPTLCTVSSSTKAIAERAQDVVSVMRLLPQGIASATCGGDSKDPFIGQKDRNLLWMFFL